MQAGVGEPSVSFRLSPPESSQPGRSASVLASPSLCCWHLGSLIFDLILAGVARGEPRYILSSMALLTVQSCTDPQKTLGVVACCKRSRDPAQISHPASVAGLCSVHRKPCGRSHLLHFTLRQAQNRRRSTRFPMKFQVREVTSDRDRVSPNIKSVVR